MSDIVQELRDAIRRVGESRPEHPQYIDGALYVTPGQGQALRDLCRQQENRFEYVIADGEAGRIPVVELKLGQLVMLPDGRKLLCPQMMPDSIIILPAIGIPEETAMKPEPKTDNEVTDPDFTTPPPPTPNFFDMPGARDLAVHLGKLIAESPDPGSWHKFTFWLRRDSDGAVIVDDPYLGTDPATPVTAWVKPSQDDREP